MQTAAQTGPSPIDPARRLLIADVDVVPGASGRRFGRFVAERGFKLWFGRLALFESLYRAGGARR